MKKLSVFFYRILKFSYRYPVWVMSSFAFVFLLSLYFSSHVKTIYDIQDTITSDFATYKSLERLRTGFHRKHNLTLLLSRSDNSELTAAEHCHIRSYFQNFGLSHDAIKKIESVYDLRTLKVTELGYTYPYLMGLECETAIPRLNENWRDIVKSSPWKSILSGNKINDTVVDLFFQEDTTPDEIDKILLQIQSEFPKPTFQLDYTGTGPFQVYVAKGYAQSQWLNLLIAAFLLVAFKIFFGGFRSGVVLILSLLYTTIVTTGLLGFLNYPIDFLTQSIFSIMTIATLEDFIFVIFLRQRKGQHWKSSYRKIIVPSFFTSLTTFIGFISLVTSDLEIIQRFGLVTALGCLVEWSVIFVLLPAMEQKFPQMRMRSAIPKINLSSRLLNSLSQWVPSKRLAILLSLFFVTWIPASQNLITNDSPSKVFNLEHPFMKSLNRIKEDRGWETQVSVVFDDYSTIENRPDIIEKLKKASFVVAVENPIDVLNFYLEKAPENLHTLLTTEVRDSFYFKKFISPDSVGQVILYISESEIRSIRRLQQEVAEICNGQCELANGLVSYTEFGDKVPRTLYESMMSGLILIALVLFGLSFLTNTSNIIPILLSSFWGPCFVVSALWATEVNINYTTCIFASICLGLAGDNAIQYMFASRKKNLDQKVDQLSQPTLIMSFLLMAIPLTFVLSYFVNMIDLGILFFFGMMANLFGDLYLLKSYLRFFSNLKK